MCAGSSSTTPTVQYIPGLPMDSLAHHQKKAQKKKRKKKPAEPLEHRGSTSSETELPPPLQELHLTDDLADFMVNPPTEPECSDEETLSCSQEAGGNLTRDPTLTSFQISPDTESAAPLQLDVELAAPLAAPMGEEEERSGQESAEMAADHTSTSSQREEPEGTPLPFPTTDEEAEVETVESVAATAAVEVLSLNAGDLDTKAMDTTAMDVAETVYVDPVNVGNTGSLGTGNETAEREGNPSPSLGSSCHTEVDVAPEEPAPRNKHKRRNRPKYVRPCPVTTHPTEEPAASPQSASQQSSSPAKSYSAVCRSGPELPLPATPPHLEQEEERETEEPVVSPPAPTTTGDQWENVPASLAAAPERWQRKKDRKRKNKKAANMEPAEEEKTQDELPEPVEEPTSLPVKEPTPTPEAAKTEPAEEMKESQSELEAEDSRKSKSMKKRRRKHTSEEPEEGHRVIICDNQVSTRYRDPNFSFYITVRAQPFSFSGDI